MSESNSNTHFMQKLLDNQWALLVLAVMTPMVFYTLWGLWDVINIPAAR